MPVDFKKRHSAGSHLSSYSSPAQSNVPLYRWLVACAFAFLQAYKLLNLGTDGSFLYFCGLDFAFITIVARLRIPWLHFRISVWFVAFSTLVVVNCFLFDMTLFKLPFLFLLKLFGRQLAVTGTRVKPQSQAHLARQHLQGTYTINYLPESYAILTADDALCVPDASTSVYFHLTLNNTTPSSVVLSAMDFEGDKWDIEFGTKQLRKLPSKSIGTITHIYLPVSEPGYYRLSQVTDKSSSSSVKAKGQLIVVPPCPTLQIYQPKQRQICKGASYSAQIELSGLPPFNVYLSNNTVFTVGEQNDDSHDLKSIIADIQLNTLRPGTSKLEILSISDALSNWNNDTKAMDINVHAPNVVQLTSNQRMPLLGGTKAHLSVEGRDLPGILTYLSPDGESHELRVVSNQFTLPLVQEGTYILYKFAGSICKHGEIKGTSQIEVFEPPPTGLKVRYQQLKDKCSGPSGINADVTFEGTPPFKVWYQTLLRSRVVDQGVQESQDQEDSIIFKPHSTGTFTYQVVAVQDRYRKVDLHGAEYEQSQTISEIAGASFQSGLKTFYCPDQVAHVTAQVQGKAPFQLVYELDGRKYTESNVQGDLAIKLGQMSGGNHRVVLKSITDVEGCTTPLNVQSPLIKVRSKVASVKFTGPKSIKVYDPKQLKLALAVKDSESSQFKLKYSINGTTPISITLKANSPELPIDQPGEYKLLELDDGCAGIVGDEIISVSVYEHPSVQLVEHDESICLNSFSDVMLQLKGEPPFKLWAETLDPRGKSAYDEKSTSNSKLKITNKRRNIPGTWTTYYWLTDKLYPKGDKSEGALVVKQSVWEEPVVMHTKAGAAYSLCQNRDTQQGIPINLHGAAPFTIKVELKDINTQKIKTRQVQVPHAGSYNLYEPFTALDSSWQVRLVEIEDARGCVSRPHVSKSTVTVNSVSAPEVSLEKYNYCVGDHVKVAAQGKGSLKLGYTLNKRKHTVSTSGKQFNLLASTPGVLHLHRLEDDGICVAALNESIVIHDLPSSHITRQPSFNIHQGDAAVELQFAFDGTPPFTFVYTRTVDGRVVERKTVRDVETHQHSIYTDENGVYEVVSLRDAHCGISY